VHVDLRRRKIGVTHPLLGSFGSGRQLEQLAIRARPVTVRADELEAGVWLDEVFGHDAERSLADRRSMLAQLGVQTEAAPLRPDSEPFVDWLRHVKAREGAEQGRRLSSADLARHLGISSGSEIRALLNEIGPPYRLKL
jgi:hypothetical protein